MFLDLDEKLSAEILKMARKFGADLAGLGFLVKITCSSLPNSVQECGFGPWPLVKNEGLYGWPGRCMKTGRVN